MRLPGLQSPEKYAGLYVFDFGDRASVGYTAEEVAILMDSGRFPNGKAYRIHRAWPDGTLELEQVSRAQIGRKDGIFFYRHAAESARRDFDDLARLAAGVPPPCRMEMHLARTGSPDGPFVTALLFSAEHTHAVSDWLHRIGFEGGDVVRGGPAEAEGYRAAGPAILDTRQWGVGTRSARSPEEVLAATHFAVQR